MNVITIPVRRHDDPDWEEEPKGNRRDRRICLYCLCRKHLKRYISDGGKTWLCRQCVNGPFRAWRRERKKRTAREEAEATIDAILDACRDFEADEDFADFEDIPLAVGNKPVRKSHGDAQRQRILDFLRKSGGMTAEEVGRAMGYNWTESVGYQLRQMEGEAVERDDGWPAVWRVKDGAQSNHS